MFLVRMPILLISAHIILQEVNDMGPDDGLDADTARCVIGESSTTSSACTLNSIG